MGIPAAGFRCCTFVPGQPYSMKKICMMIALCLMAGAGANAQEVYNSSGARTTVPKKPTKPKGFDPQRLIFGGGLGLSFGDVTSIGVAPIIGYRITENFAGGVGLGYQYLRVKDYIYIQGTNYDYKTNLISPSVWLRHIVFSNFFAHAEYEHNFMTFTDYRFDPNGSGNIESYKLKYNSPALLLGAGFRQPVTENSSFIVLALYDVIQDKYSPYYNRLDFRFGFNVGF